MAEALEDKIECTQFESAAGHLPKILAKKTLSEDVMLYLYARFKQATEGVCNVKKPSFFEFQARKKWEAWKEIERMNQEQAKDEYIAKISELDPEWKSTLQVEVQKTESWVTVSSMLEGRDEYIPDENKSVYDWCRDGNLDMVKRDVNQENINLADSIGLTLLHWSCDRGQADIVQYLIINNADVNIEDPEGQTPLHYACSCGYADIVKVLLENRADPQRKDKSDLTPLQVAEDDDIKKLVSSWVFWKGSGESCYPNQ